jgi:hypothetical protein
MQRATGYIQNQAGIVIGFSRNPHEHLHSKREIEEIRQNVH